MYVVFAKAQWRLVKRSSDGLPPPGPAETLAKGDWVSVYDRSASEWSTFRVVVPAPGGAAPATEYKTSLEKLVVPLTENMLVREVYLSKTNWELFKKGPTLALGSDLVGATVAVRLATARGTTTRMYEGKVVAATENRASIEGHPLQQSKHLLVSSNASSDDANFWYAVEFDGGVRASHLTAAHLPLCMHRGVSRALLLAVPPRYQVQDEDADEYDGDSGVFRTWLDFGSLRWRLMRWPDLPDKTQPDKTQPDKTAGGNGGSDSSDDENDEAYMRDITSKGPSAGPEMPIGQWLLIHATVPARSSGRGRGKGTPTTAGWHYYYVSQLEAGSDRKKNVHEVVALDGVRAWQGQEPLPGVFSSRELVLHDTVWRPVRKGPRVATAMNQAAVMIKHDFELDNHPSGELLQRQWWDAEVVDFEAEGDNFDASSPRGGERSSVVGGHKSGRCYHKVKFFGLVRSHTP